MLYLASNLLALIALSGLFLLTGWLVDRWLMDGRGLEPVPAAGRFGLGAAVWMAWVFLLASVQALSAYSLGLVALLTVLAWWLRRPRLGQARSVGKAAAVARGRDPLIWFLAAVLGALLLVLWLQVLWPRLSWDADAYHLTVPRLYLEHGGFRRIPFNVYSNWPLNLQLLFALAMVVRDYVLAKALHFVFGLATLLLLYRLVASIAGSWAGLLAASLLVINPIVLDEFRAAYVDLALAFFFLLAFVMLHRALESGEDEHRRLVLVGVFGGVAAGVKPTGIAVVVCLLTLYLTVEWRRGGSPARSWRGLALIAVPALLLLAPWAVKSWVFTGNPVYPFQYAQWGGPEWSVALGEQLRAWQQGMGMGRSWVDYLMLPYRVFLSGGPGYDSFDGRASPLWVVLVPVALALGWRRPVVVRGLVVAGLYFVLWALSSQQMRFLIPMLPFLSIAFAVSVGERIGESKGLGGRMARWGVTVAVIATLGVVGGGMIGPAGRMLAQYREMGIGVMEDVEHPVFRFIDRELPAEAKLMFLNTNHGFFCRREFVADSFFEASQINDLLRSRQGAEGVRDALEELGITHLLIENRDRFVPWPRSLYEFLNDPAQARRIYRSDDGVYDVVELGRRPQPRS